MVEPHNQSPVQRQFDPIFKRRIGELRASVDVFPLGIVERDTFRRILCYAVDATLTQAQVSRMAQLSETWFRDAIDYASTGPCPAADEALAIAALYDEFARTLTPYAKIEDPQ